MTSRPADRAGGDEAVGDLDPAVLAADLRVALMRAARRIRGEKADLDLSDGQLSVLAVLHRTGPLTNRELADFEHVQPPSMTRTLACLEERALVTRTPHPADGRQLLVTLTEDGRATVLDTRRRRDAWLTRRLDQLDPDERAVLARAGAILRRIADS